jgi:hypothetical protein
MDTLWLKTFARTATSPPKRRWERHIAFARNYPDDYHIVGLFGPGYPNQGSLAAFGCAMNNVDHAVYSDGASTRGPEVSTALSYAIMWDLIRWAKARGCSWFDLGGITAGTHGDPNDLRGGISDFKRRFTDRVVEVGGEWEIVSNSWQSAFSEGMSSTASLVKRLLD